MSPILVRPVREQLEHDRIIRLLQMKLRRKFEVGINPGAEHNVPVGTGASLVYPDLVLLSLERGRRLQGVVEVETGESVNHLEALAQWVHLARLRAAFHLYVPAGMVDVARRLSEANQVHANEIWSYHSLGDQVRFTLVHRSREAATSRPRVARPSRSAAPRSPKPSVRSVKRAKPASKAASAKTAKNTKKPARTRKRK